MRARLTALLGERVRSGVALARHTSFRIGGPAEVFVEPDTVAELQTLVALCHVEKEPVFLLGGGTNLLVSDTGVRGVVVKLGEGFNYTRWEERGETALVHVGAARSLGRFVRETVKKGYGGLEFAEGIPGSVGGGLLMNAGAFGGELGEVITAVTGVCPDGHAVSFPRARLGFSYRCTALPAQVIVTEIACCVRQKKPQALMAAMDQARDRRQRTQPHGSPNAGSIFKNPPGAYAGQLIEAAGLKGLWWGHARVSEQHANFIVNTGGAKAAEVKHLMEYVQKAVWTHSRIWLEPEIRLVGEW